VICNNGDYDEDDLIVFCSNCFNGVHQSCYGLDKVPDGEFVCQTCFTFDEPKEVRCALCTQLGGIMRPTNKLMKFQKKQLSTSKTSKY